MAVAIKGGPYRAQKGNKKKGTRQEPQEQLSGRNHKIENKGKEKKGKIRGKTKTKKEKKKKIK